MMQTGGNPPPLPPPSDAPSDPELIMLKELEKDEVDGCCSQQAWTSRTWMGVAIASAAVNLAALVLELSIVCYIAGGIAAAIAPIVVYYQFLIGDEDTLRNIQNALRQQVNRLAIANNKLKAEVDKLEVQVDRLKECETRLEVITKDQGSNVDKFVELVKENRIIIDELKRAVAADTTQSLVSAIIESDFDSSGEFSPQEVKILEMRMRNIKGILVNQYLLNKAIDSSDRSLASILALVAHLTDDSIPDDKRIFRVNEDSIKEFAQ